MGSEGGRRMESGRESGRGECMEGGVGGIGRVGGRLGGGKRGESGKCSSDLISLGLGTSTYVDGCTDGECKLDRDTTDVMSALTTHLSVLEDEQAGAVPGPGRKADMVHSIPILTHTKVEPYKGDRERQYIRSVHGDLCGDLG